MSGICLGELVMCLGDFNGHVGRHIARFDGVRGGYGVGQRNSEGRMLSVLSGEGIMSNAWSTREEKRKVMFRMGENETEIDLMLIKKEH